MMPTLEVLAAAFSFFIAGLYILLVAFLIKPRKGQKCLSAAAFLIGFFCSALLYAQTASRAFKLSWQDNSNNEEGFFIYRDGQQVGAVAKDVTTFTDTLTGPYGQQFCWQVSAFNHVNADGTGALQESAKSNTACATLPAAPALPVPNAPSGLTTAATAQTTIQTSWELNNPIGTVSVILTRQRTQPPELQTIKLGVDTQTYIDNNLPRKQTFCYQARAENAAGISPVSNQSCATTR